MGSTDLFQEKARTAILGATEDTTQEIPAAKLVNNMLRAFKALQVRARAILAKRRGVKLDDVDWRLGNLHDFRAADFSNLAVLNDDDAVFDGRTGHRVDRFTAHDDLCANDRNHREEDSRSKHECPFERFHSDILGSL